MKWVFYIVFRVVFLKKKNKNYNDIIKLIDNMIHPNIQNRFNIKQCMDLINKFSF